MEVSTADKCEELLNISKFEDELKNFVSLVKKSINLSKKYLHSTSCQTVGERKKWESELCKLKSLKLKAKHRLSTYHVGGAITESRTFRKRSDRVKWVDVQSAFKSRMRTSCVVNLNHKFPEHFLDDAFHMMKTRLKNAMKSHPTLKVNVELHCKFQNTNTEAMSDKVFNTRNVIITSTTPFAEVALGWKETILNNMESFVEQGSGWVYKAVTHLLVGINVFQPMAGGSRFIKLPHWIQRKNAVLNIVNFDDDHCFLYCILAHLFPVKHNYERPESYPQNFSDHFNLKNLEMPMKISNIKKFENQNPSISVNVFGVGDNETILGPLYHTKEKKQNHVNLLLLTERHRSHYCLIKDLSRLVGSSISSHKTKKFICDRCLNHFNSKSKFQQHDEDCMQFKPAQIIMPTVDNSILRFSAYKAMLRKPFVIYADIESLTVPIKTCDMTASTSFTFKYENHVPFSLAYRIVCSFDSKYNKFESYSGEDCISWFINQLKKECAEINSILKREIRPMEDITDSIKQAHEETMNCPVCKCRFSSQKNIKVHHHDHYTGKYMFSCCNSCNLKMQKENSVSVFFHNLSNYDGPLVLLELQKSASITVIPLTTEKYISFTAFLGSTKVIFLDSFRFLSESLDKLSSSLSDEQMKFTKSQFPDPEQFKLVTRKGVYPYDYTNDWSKLRECSLPEKSQFYNKLKDEHISDEDYQHAQTVWETFGCKTLLDYSMLYLTGDVNLLTDIFENFRDLTMKNYGLDAACFYTSPGLSWAAALKYTKVELELFTDVDMFNFVCRGIRGGITQSIHRYAKANNPYLPNFNHNEPPSWLCYWDVNNLYGFAMSMELPVGGFKWLTEKEISNINSALVKGNFTQIVHNNESKSYFFEVDLEYDESLHSDHNFLPFCPEHLAPPNCKEKKLICSLTNKHRYVIHVKNLIQCMSAGLRLTKIHRGLEFVERAWLKPYIDLNTKFRMKAKNDFEKDFFKLLINAVFGKTIENDRLKRDVKLVNSWKSARKLIIKPNYVRHKIINEDFVIIEMAKTEINVNKPIYCGFSVLELSKTKMYDFHYNYVMKELRPLYENVTLCYMDTDSFIYYFVGKKGEEYVSIYDVIRRDANKMFDTTNYPKENICNIPRVNGKVPGLMKDELPKNNEFNVMSEWISLRPKVYCMKYFKNVLQPSNDDDGNIGDKTVRKVKGVGKSASRDITFEDFRKCLFENVSTKSSFNTLRTEKFEIYGVNVTKIALSASDNKRFIKDDNVNTLAWGHKNLA